MTREEEAVEILQALMEQPDSVFHTCLPGYAPEQIKKTLLWTLKRIQPKASAVSPSPLPTLSLYTDGASRGNPGEAGAGAVILDEKGGEVQALSQYLGQCTNNVAEYQALILGLSQAVKLKGKTISIFLDSQLIVRQVQGLYKVKNKALQPLFSQVKELLKKFEKFEISHIPRSENKRADQLANQGIDGQ